MKTTGITGKSSRLFLILFISLFCFANPSFSEDGERIKYIGDRICSESNHKKLVRDEAKEGKSILIRLGREHFDPLRRSSVQKAGIQQIQAYEKEETGYYIVQFDGPVENSWKEALKDTGADIFDYIPDFAFIVRMDATEEDMVRAIAHVRWIGIYQPSYRISQSAFDKMFTKEAAEAETPSVLLRITVFPGEDFDRIKSEITALDGIVIDEITTKWKTTFKIEIPPDKIADLPPISGIKWVEPWPKWRLFNDKSTDVISVRTPRDTHGLYGAGQTVGVCDTGLDQGSTIPANLHDDFEDGSGGSRVTRIFDRVRDGADDVNSGHGTHVAGSVLGNGLESGSDPSSNTFPFTCFAGMAPKAGLVFQAVEDNLTESLSGLPPDLNILFSQADGAGADLHTNSWGNSTVSGMYSSNSQDVDEYMWSHKDFLILFSAGNDGIDMDGDGVVDLYSLGEPATAKNCLTVGASEGNRPTLITSTWGGSWPFDYSVNPIYSDLLADDPDGMAAFSSRGPCLDGRYKPDIVAPGTYILSTRSSLVSGTGWEVYDDYYMYNDGTSMACPLTAGAAALMREYLINEKEFTSPSAALIKAALLNTAEDISPGQHGTGAAQEIPDSPVPNNVEGWGRLNLGNGVYPQSPFNILYYDEQSSLNTGEHREYAINVSGSGFPLKINLVWTDYPGSTAAQGGLVNDLDLQVTDPSSTVHYPDRASQKSAISSIAYDDGSPEYYYKANKLSVRFTPSAYPANVESTTFYFYNPDDKTTNVDVVVYGDNGTGGLPGTQLFRKTLTYVPSGWITIGITGVVINSGDFYIAIEKNDTAQSLYQDYPDFTGRSYHDTGSGWTVDTDYMTYIRANVRGVDYSTSFDRVNNVVGLTLDNPAAGTYTVKVSGYNVPYGPQPYALVVSGSMTEVPLYFPHIASAETWETEICVINTSDTQTLNGVFKAYSDAGVLISEIDAVTLAPHARREITVGDEFTDPWNIGNIVFESDSNTVVGYTKFYIEGQYRVAVPAVSEINTGDIYISHIHSDSSWWTGISLLNTTSSPRTLTIEFDNGETKTKRLAANEHNAFTIKDLFEGQSQPGIQSAVIKQASGVVGLELFGSGSQLSGILLKDNTVTKIYYPHVASDATWWTGIVAYNPSDTSFDITITPYTETGDSLTTTKTHIDGKEKYIGTVADLSLPGDTAWFQIETESSITGFELFGTQNGNQLAGYTGVGISGKEGIFAKLEKDGWTGIAFVNIENSSATVTLTAYDDSGNLIATETLNVDGCAKVVNLPENVFTQDISSATYIGYSSNKEVVGFQLNSSADNIMLDGLPGM